MLVGAQVWVERSGSSGLSQGLNTPQQDMNFKALVHRQDCAVWEEMVLRLVALMYLASQVPSPSDPNREKLGMGMGHTKDQQC